MKWICIFLQKLSGKNAPHVIFWTNQPKYSKSDDFARVYSIINHDLFWCQKPTKTNLRMTLGLIFNHLFWTHHFGAFSVLHTKYSSIFGDKKVQTQKWCIAEKFQPQKFGVTKGYFILKVVSDCDFDHFLEKMSPVPPGCSTFRSGLTW